VKPYDIDIARSGLTGIGVVSTAYGLHPMLMIITPLAFALLGNVFQTQITEWESTSSSGSLPRRLNSSEIKKANRFLCDWLFYYVDNHHGLFYLIRHFYRSFHS